MEKSLLIVESPAKARTIQKFLGKEFQIKASMGHIRDLPVKRFGVKIEEDFAPQYQILSDKKKIARELAESAKGSGIVYIATDEDREGEAIGWHLLAAARIDEEKVKRIVFHEITRTAIEEALKSPRGIDMNLVNAQQARRILDRLVGYKISPILGKKVRRGLSAGRVQSVALRLIVDREREIEQFNPQEYWTIEAELKTGKGETFLAKLAARGEKKYGKLDIATEKEAESITADLKDKEYRVKAIGKKEKKRYASPPFTTSTLSQTASSRLGFSPRKTLFIAQQLYEGIELGEEGSTGLITYMRTDSVNIAATARDEARKFVKETYGSDYIPPKPNFYKTKAKRAQEAHEAIRPTAATRKPEQLKNFLTPEQFKLYSLIWSRFLASQMSPAVFDTVSIDISAGDYLLRAAGQSLKFAGFLKVYEQEIKETLVPEVSENEILELLKVIPEQHFTDPPPRYTEATLIKTLEKYGIGRPSTYAPTISTILTRGYVRLEKRMFFPEDIGIVVNDLLVKYFPEIVDIEFTARLEDGLDEIASGKREWVPLLSDFYRDFKKDLEVANEKMENLKPPPIPTDEVCEKCGAGMVIKEGRWGKFLACSAFPECKNAKPLPTGLTCPECKADLVLRYSKKRRSQFYGCSNYPECKYTRKKGDVSEEVNEGEKQGEKEGE